MKAVKLMLIMVLVVVGLIHRWHAKPPHDSRPQMSVAQSVAQSAVHQEIVQNAEHLEETLRKCKQTAHQNRETR